MAASTTGSAPEARSNLGTGAACKAAGADTADTAAVDTWDTAGVA